WSRRWVQAKGDGRRHRAEAPLVLALFLAVALGLFSSTWLHPARSLVGVPADNVLTTWCFQWVSFALGHGRSIFLTHHIGAPGGVNLLTSTPVTLGGLVLAPVTAAVGSVVAYNLAATLGVALSGWCAYLACRRYAAGLAGPVAGGLIYGLSPYMLAQSYGHLQLTMAWVPPLMLLLLDQVLVRQSRPAPAWGALLGLLAAAQLYLGSELLVTEVVAGVVGTVLLVVCYPGHVRGRAGHAAVALATGAGVFVVLGGWPLWVAFLGPGHLPAGAIRGHGSLVDDLENFVVPTAVQAVVPPAASRAAGSFAAGLVESNAYLGAPVLVVAVGTAVAGWRRPVVRVLALLGLVMAVCSLGPVLEVGGRVTGIPLPWRVVQHLPVVRDVIPSRLAVFTDLAAAVLAAVAVGEVGAWAAQRTDRWAASRQPGQWDSRPPGRRVARRQPGPWDTGPTGRRAALWARLGLAGGLALVAASLFPRLPYPSEPLTVPAFFTTAAVDRVPAGSTALVLPMDTSSSLLWQAEAGMRWRMPENHFGTGPRPPSPLGPLAGVIHGVQAGGARPVLSPARRSALAGDLSRACVTTVLLGPMPHRAAMAGLMGRVLQAPPAEVAGVSVWAGLPGCG
ncbi:MAG: hypothetical protein ACRD0J_11835, partial [Acidimicrobiales bacterium]